MPDKQDRNWAVKRAIALTESGNLPTTIAGIESNYIGALASKFRNCLDQKNADPEEIEKELIAYAKTKECAQAAALFDLAQANPQLA